MRTTMTKLGNFKMSKIWETLRKFTAKCFQFSSPVKVISVEDVAWQNSMRLNRHEEFSRFCRVDRNKTISVKASKNLLTLCFKRRNKKCSDFILYP